ncbi:MAG TPA: SAM-dependent chlorinase/fluorinase [Vicinamibacterales bacterium]|nr:SAM-dependent chlorinase/fluorinase [Vicinamibacterales bacterium]
MRPVVALLTDFGVRDHYAGTMKGVVLGICPDTTLVDISHDVPPHDLRTAALELAASYRFFPAGTVFLVVVDPGVGSGRRPLAAEAGDYRFVAPDNGVLTAVFKETPPRRVVELTERRYGRPTVSRTFEGRDRFAPAAGWLAKGVEVRALGRPLTDYVLLTIPDPEVGSDEIRGAVLRVDRFGNLITNIDRRAYDRLARLGGRLHIRVGAVDVAQLVSTYAEVPAGEVAGLFGSSDHLELAANSASAAALLGSGVDATVTVTREGGEQG